MHRGQERRKILKREIKFQVCREKKVRQEWERSVEIYLINDMISQSNELRLKIVKEKKENVVIKMDITDYDWVVFKIYRNKYKTM